MTLRRRGSRRYGENRRQPRVMEVRGGSPCSGLVRPGDLLLEIDGRRPLDILDVLEASERDRITLRLLREGKAISRKIRKEAGIPLGLVLDEVVFDGVRACRNSCVFCFVDQMPPGMRPALYEKDDDYRLSFYNGNFITLNNLSGGDMRRIRKLRLSPLYVSLHSTDASVRSGIMGGNARGGLDNLRILLDEGLEVHLQVVVCPGINDAQALRRTLGDVLDIYPAASLGVVPVGLTSRAAEVCPELIAHNGDSARKIIEIVDEYQAEARERLGRRLVYAADEFYLLAGLAFPAADEYEGYPQLENGIGMARKLIDEAADETASILEVARPARGVITGIAAEEMIWRILEESGLSGAEVLGVENSTLGGSVTVSALLGGGDIITALRAKGPSSSELIIPASMLRDGYFIDDLTPGDIERETGYVIIPVEVDGGALIRAVAALESAS